MLATAGGGWNGGERKKQDETHLRHQTLEEAGEAFFAGHVGQDLEAALGVVKVAVLDARLDDVQGRRHDEGGRSTADRGDKVLVPGGLVVVLKTKDELLGKGRATEELNVSDR